MGKDRKVVPFRSNVTFADDDEVEDFDRLCWCGRFRSEHQWTHENGDLTVTFTLNH